MSYQWKKLAGIACSLANPQPDDPRLCLAQHRHEFVRFGYVPMGATFRLGSHGTIDFVKETQDEARCSASECLIYFDLTDRCAIVNPPEDL